MKKIKCSGCNKKVNKDFNYCPYCGKSFKENKQDKDYGFLGKSDIIRNQNPYNNDVRLPFGLNKMMSSLIKQLEKELSGINPQDLKGGLNFKIHTSNIPNIQKPNKKSEDKKQKLSEDEISRRSKLPKEEALSRIKRLSDKIIYEIETPGIKDKSQISINNLEKGIEFKAYTKKICYTKTIPLKLKIDNFKILKDKVLIEFKS